MEIKIEVEDSEMEDSKEEQLDEYEIQCKVKTLIEAEMIKNDANLMSQIKDHLEKTKTAVNSIEGLRKKRSELQKAAERP